MMLRRLLLPILAAGFAALAFAAPASAQTFRTYVTNNAGQVKAEISYNDSNLQLCATAMNFNGRTKATASTTPYFGFPPVEDVGGNEFGTCTVVDYHYRGRRMTVTPGFYNESGNSFAGPKLYVTI